MNQHRGPLLLILLAVLAVSSGYASPIRKSANNGDFGFHSTYAISSSTSTDNWLGGTGNWSDSWCWGSGLPSGGSDVMIYSGGDDLVYLDMSASIASLTLGGDTGSAQLVDNGAAQTLTVAGALTVNQTGTLYLAAGNTVTAGADSGNAGLIQLENGSALQINGNLSNAGTIYLGNLDSSSGSLTVTGRLDNSGLLQLGRSDAISSSSATLGSLVNSGSIQLGLGTTLQVAGAMNNSGTVGVGSYDGLLGSQAQFGSLVNSGSVEIGLGSSLTVTGDVNNTANGWVGLDGMTHVTIDGSFTNNGSLVSGRNWGGDEIGIAGSLTNNGDIELNGSAQLAVRGTANNAGNMVINGGFETAAFASFGSLINSGTIQINNGSGVGVAGVAINTGTISALWGQDGAQSTFSANYLGNSGSISSNFEVGWLNNSGSILLQYLNGYGVVHGNLVNSGDISLDGGYLTVGRDVTNSGRITIGASLPNNEMDIAGKLINTATGNLDLHVAQGVVNVASVVNQGTISIGSDSVLNVTGGPHAGQNALPGFLNTGIVNIGEYGNLNVVGNYTQLAGHTSIDGTLQIQGRGMAIFAGGSVSNGYPGTISGSVFSNAAISPYQLSILGNYTQGPKGSLAFDIFGTAPGWYDQLSISGQARLNGLMTVELLDGFVPELGDDFDIMHFGSESGKFSMVMGLPINGQEHFVLEYNPTDLTLDVVAGPLSGADNGEPVVIASNVASDGVSDIPSGTSSTITPDYGRFSPTPEPGSLLLLGSGLMCVGYAVRRRMGK